MNNLKQLLFGMAFLGLGLSCRAAEPIPLAISTLDHPHTQSIFDGRILIPECQISYSTRSLSELNLLFDQNSAGDIIEVDFLRYLKQFSAEEKHDWVLVPVFPWREFPQRHILVRSDHDIHDFAELAGSTVGVHTPNQSIGVWARGILESSDVVKSASLTWDSSLVSSMSFVRPLFPDYKTIEQSYFHETRIFPIMTVLAVRKELADANPWLPEAIFIAFSDAKRQALESDTLPLPWGADHREETISLMKKNYWSYGVKNNPRTLSALFQYANEQGITTKDLKPDDVFAPETLQLIDEKGEKN